MALTGREWHGSVGDSLGCLPVGWKGGRMEGRRPVRIARFSAGGDPAFGVVVGDGAEATIAEIEGHPIGAFRLTGRQLPLADVRLLAPIIPSKVVAIGKNYAEHAAEMGGDAPAAPLIFLKPSTAVTGPGLSLIHISE